MESRRSWSPQQEKLITGLELALMRARKQLGLAASIGEDLGLMGLVDDVMNMKTLTHLMELELRHGKAHKAAPPMPGQQTLI
jgi:hypothetical protein